ncbi:MAG: hypothetical protein DELT_00969 [Desulfovibrio sp.]
MASNVNSILGIGAGALYAHQNSIQTTGNNIANVDTEGYSRQAVRYETNPSLNAYPGQIGQGVRATEVYRMFNTFVEKAYISKASDSSRWAEQYALLTNVDSLVYESDTVPGIADTLNLFFEGWQTLSKNGTLLSNREALLSNAETLTGYVRETDEMLKYMQAQMDGLIQTDVDRANQLIQEIAQLNGQINLHSIPGQNNPNALLDQRDLKVRQLAEIIDIEIIDRGEGHYTVSTKSGLTLVDEDSHFELEFFGAKVNDYRSRNPASTYTGEVHFEGSDEYEYTVEVVTGGTVGTSGTPGTAQFRVSLDGGKTWMKDENGNDLLFDANDETKAAYIGDGIKVWFDSGAGPLLAAGDVVGGVTASKGDTFEIVPKSGIYWKNPTGEERVNITPMTMADGTMNTRRSTGGTLTAYFEFRDNLLGGYRERLDNFATTLAWEVNRIHSQGAGLEKLSNVLGDYQIDNRTQALGGPYSGCAFADKLQDGNFTFALYDKNGDPLLDENGTHQMVSVAFSTTDSLDDVVANINAEVTAVNATRAAQVPPLDPVVFSAAVTDSRLELKTGSDFSFGVVNDSSGAMAALGINTFFKGESANDFGVNAAIIGNLNLINAGAINGGGEGNTGDTITALDIAQLSTKKVTFTNRLTGRKTEQTVLEYYANFVTKVGADTQSAKYNAALYGTMASDLRSQQDSIAGVNLDEEMTNLVRFQNSYKAAAKLITTADEMLQTIIGLKQ